MTTPRDDIAGLIERLRDLAPDDDEMPVTRKAILEAATQLAALSARVKELERIERNRDMWKGQCERQAKALTELREEAAELVVCQYALSAAEARVKELEALVYVPGSWHCPKCKFTLLQSNLNAQDGTVTARDTPGDKCPNCTGPLWRCSWKNDAFEMQERAVEQMERAKAAEARATRLQQERDAAYERAAKQAEQFASPHSIDLGKGHVAWRIAAAIRQLAGPEKEG